MKVILIVLLAVAGVFGACPYGHEAVWEVQKCMEPMERLAYGGGDNVDFNTGCRAAMTMVNCMDTLKHNCRRNPHIQMIVGNFQYMRNHLYSMCAGRKRSLPDNTNVLDVVKQHMHHMKRRREDNN
ncbi:uncharacterized protein LOC124267837 [Haliotis rubra]|uniref:uncharacterized protein LOC124267837 n=1 Tax=Haliotis rubra TaxID=36100 RepID=UPI001EE58BF3|nr:uncharacterized protein LOC124267837 [Haliotis rubra]